MFHISYHSNQRLNDGMDAIQRGGVLGKAIEGRENGDCVKEEDTIHRRSVRQSMSHRMQLRSTLYKNTVQLSAKCKNVRLHSSVSLHALRERLGEGEVT